VNPSFVLNIIDNLSQFIVDNGYVGYDPYDFKDWVNKNTHQKSILRIKGHHLLEYGEVLFPVSMRKILNLEPQYNAKAFGLLLASYLNLYKFEKKQYYFESIQVCKNWLLSNSSNEFKGLSWGYPFDWYNATMLIPKGTPSSVVSAIVGDGFWKDYIYNNDIASLKICEKICEFYMNELSIDKIDENKICFSYTPLDDFHVHNANLFVAEFLIKIGKETKNENYVHLGKLAANYAISEQNDDGSIYYWGRVQNHKYADHLDHYHSGFELRMLFSISQLVLDKIYKSAFKRYFKFYLKNFFSEEGFPKYSPKSLYPINIHSCAESILCLTVVDSQKKIEVEQLINMINDKMLTKKGWFLYMIRKVGPLKIKSRIPYLRWGQAWMMRALSEYLIQTAIEKK